MSDAIPETNDYPTERMKLYLTMAHAASDIIGIDPKYHKGIMIRETAAIKPLIGAVAPILYDTDNNLLQIMLLPNLPIFQVAITIGHELIHVKQMLDKRLRIKFKEFHWMGQVFDHKAIPYRKWPWEVEAHSQHFKLGKELLKVRFR